MSRNKIFARKFAPVNPSLSTTRQYRFASIDLTVLRYSFHVLWWANVNALNKQKTQMFIYTFKFSGTPSSEIRRVSWSRKFCAVLLACVDLLQIYCPINGQCQRSNVVISWLWIEIPRTSAGNVSGAGFEVWLHQYRIKQSFINPNASRFQELYGYIVREAQLYNSNLPLTYKCTRKWPLITVQRLKDATCKEPIFLFLTNLLKGSASMSTGSAVSYFLLELCWLG